MDVVTMINHYKVIFKNPNDILDWIEHDLVRLGLGQEEIDKEINEAKKILGV